MFFYIVDDDAAVRSMLTEIIEDEDLGAVTGEVQDGSELCNNIPALKKTDILLIDLLMPNLDGIETIRTIKPFFTGKTIMISQVESKELISKAYSLGTEYYITKPVNRIEVISVIKKVAERIRLERSMLHIHQSLSHALSLGNAVQEEAPSLQPKITDSGQILLSDLGVLGENGCKDLLEILDYLFWLEETETFKKGFPRVKDIFMMLAKERLGSSASGKEIAREVKASEQRVRRTIFQSLNHLSSLGLDDFSNPVFESYAPKFFDFAIVRERMSELKNEQALSTTQIRINAKKFIQVLYFEAKRLM
ncbi:response regulator [Evansella clarkii]|uniref:response regulator n=1 Tax=Evansella clarkii TaxID=79879 RepID=UPI000B42D01B|nr:response regulator [Evansella clarkii]